MWIEEPGSFLLSPLRVLQFCEWCAPFSALYSVGFSDEDNDAKGLTGSGGGDGGGWEGAWRREGGREGGEKREERGRREVEFHFFPLKRLRRLQYNLSQILSQRETWRSRFT